MSRPSLAETGRYRETLELLREHAGTFPDKTFIQSIDQRKEITYGEAYRLCNRMAHFFREHGVRANDRIALLGDNSLEYLLILLGIQRYGAAACAINIEMNEAHILSILDALKPKMLLWEAGLDDKEYVRKSRGGSRIIRYEAWPPAPSVPSEDLFAQINSMPEEPERPAVNTPQSHSSIVYTSGTTQRPKGVISTYDGRFHGQRTLNVALGLSSEDRILEYRSLGWASAQAYALMAPLYCGASAFVARRFSQSRFFDWITNFKITVVVGVPAVINMLVNRPSESDRVELPSVRFMTSSTSALPLEQQKKFEAMYGIPVVTAYGMSEGGWLAASGPTKRKLGSVGSPGISQELRIVGPDGAELPRGEIGEIETGGPCVAVGYLNYDGTIDPIEGGRLKTGDLGYLDSDNFLFITGRSKELIIRGGVNISPLEIEGALLQHADIAEAAVVGVPDPIYGEEVVAYVVTRQGALITPEAVMEHCASRFTDYKRPKEAHVIDSIPKNQRAKTDRAALVERWKRARNAL